MKTSIKLFIVTCLTIISITNCKKTETPVVVPDTTKPDITITQPTAGQSFTSGNTIPVQISFSDNVQLSTYEIAISKVATSAFVLKNVPTYVAWTYTKLATSFNTGVNQQTITLSDIVIPTLIGTDYVATGKYNFKVTCHDNSANLTETTVEININ